MIYRDRKTGRFASKATWTRSKARGGKRYVRQNPKRKPQRKQKSQPQREEFIVHFDYGQTSKKKGDQRIQFQVHVFGPKGATFDDAINAIRTRNQDEPWPKGWSKRAIYWTKPRDKGKRRTDPLPPSLRQAALAVGAVSFTDRKNRGNQ